jgi:YD repeat-containing protein
MGIITRDSEGLIESIELPNGTTMIFERDSEGKLTGWSIE